jgi:HlyD family secretion protein
MKTHSYYLSALAAGIAISALGCGGASSGNPPEAVRSAGVVLERVMVARPLKKSLRLESTQPGRIEAFEETPLYSKLSSYVEKVAVDIGDRVEKDQVLVKLWVPELVLEVRQKEAQFQQARTAIEQARASLKAAEAAIATKQSKVVEAEAGIARAEGQLERWTGELDRFTKLVESGSVTQRVVDETKNQVQAATASRAEVVAGVTSARAELAQSQAFLERAKADVGAAQAQSEVAEADRDRAAALLEYSEIRAPFDGIIAARNVDTRHFVQPATGSSAVPLVVVVASNKVRVSADLPEMEAALVDKNDPAVVRVQALGNRVFTGAVTRDAWSLNAMNRSLRVEVDLDNPDGILRPGMYALVTIELAKTPDSLVLPVSAVLRDATGPYCMVVAEGIVQKRRLETGLRSGTEIEVRSGLSADDAIVSVRGDSLAEGQSVDVIAAK